MEKDFKIEHYNQADKSFSPQLLATELALLTAHILGETRFDEIDLDPFDFFECIHVERFPNAIIVMQDKTVLYEVQRS